MLSEFNSDKAVGSAMQEAEKSANNWSGSLNKLKNSWAEFANQIINSDEAIKLIQSINTIIQSLTESAATGTLKTIGQGLNSIVQILAKIIDKFDVLSPLITSIFVGKLGKVALNGKTIFGTVTDEAEGAIPQITLFGKKMSDIKKSAGSIDGNPILNLGKAFTSAEIKAFALEVAVSALNAAITFGLSLAITEGIKFISKWINKSKEAAEAAEQLRKEQEERRQEAVNNISTYEQEADALSDLTDQYVKLVSSTEDISSIKDDLLSIQDQLVEKYGNEAKAIDLVNGSLSEQLELLQGVQKEEAQKWLRDNKQAIDEAGKLISGLQDTSMHLGISADDLFGKRFDSEDTALFEFTLKKYLTAADKLSKFSFSKQTDDNTGRNLITVGIDPAASIDEQIDSINALITAYDNAMSEIGSAFTTKEKSDMEAWRKQLLEYANSLTEANQILVKSMDMESLIKTVDTYENLSDDVKSTFNDLATQMQALGQKMNAPGATDSMIYQYTLDLADLKSQMEALVTENPALSESMELLFKNVELGVSGIIASASDLRGAWLETFDSMHKEALSDVEKIEKAMQTLAEGDYLDFDTFKELVWDMDADGVIQNIKQIDDQYKLSTEELIRLKDALIQKQKEQITLDTESAQKNIEQNKKQIAALQAEIDRQIASGIRSTGDEAIINALRTKMNELTDANAAFGDEIKRNNQLIQEYNRHLGNTTDISKVLEANISKLKDEISDLNDKADKMLKAQEKQIDNIVDGLEDEKEALESQKQELENQLSVLEAQKDELDEIIENYKNLANIVGDTIDKEIEAIEKERQAVEDYYDDLISKLQKQNEERETALDLAEKMANLENARNNKVHTYDETRGWVYETDLEAVRRAENELESAKVEQQISELEKQKETALLEGGYDERIEQLGDYKGEYQSIIDEIQEAEDEQLAAELLGADWREKIRAMDKETLDKFRTNFRSYNSQLSSLVNGEIKTLKDSISAKEKEIKAKDEQITAWNKYKQAVTEAAQSVKDSLEGYDQYLGTLTLDENSSYADRITNLQNFVSQYMALMDEIANKNSVLEYQQGLLNDIGGSVSSGNGRIEGLAEGIKNSVVEMFEKISDLFKQIIKRVAQGSGESLKTIFNDVFGSFSGGGVADQTGLAMLHGTKTQSETIFNATQSKKLYDYVNQTPNLIADVMDRAYKLNGISLNSSGNSTSTKTITFEKPTIVLEGVNNPNEFMRQMDNYLQVTLTESQVKK